MDTNSQISVIIPAYNAARWLPRAVEACRTQTLSPTEIIIVDDASSDATLDVAKQLAAQHARVNVLRHKRNSGPAAARNRGAAESRGEFLAFLDADDHWDPTKLEKQMRAMRAQPQTGLVLTAVRERNMHGLTLREMWHRIPETRQERVRAFFTFKLNMLTPTALMPRHVFEEVGGFDPDLRIGEDYFLFMKIAAAYEMIYLPELLVDRWVVPFSHSKSGSPAYMETEFKKFIDASLRKFPYLHEYVPIVTAKVHFQIGRRFQREDDLRGARRHFLRSLFFRPRLKPLLALLTAILPRSWQAMFRETPRRWRLLAALSLGRSEVGNKKITINAD